MTVTLWGTLRGTAGSLFGNEPWLIPLLGGASLLCSGFINSDEPGNNCFSFWWDSLSSSSLGDSGAFMGERGPIILENTCTSCLLLHISPQPELPVLCYGFRHSVFCALHLHLGLEVILNFNLLVMGPEAGSGGILPESLPSTVSLWLVVSLSHEAKFAINNSHWL